MKSSSSWERQTSVWHVFYVFILSPCPLCPLCETIFAFWRTHLSGNAETFRSHRVHRERKGENQTGNTAFWCGMPSLETPGFGGHRGVTSGLTSKAHEVSRFHAWERQTLVWHVFCVFIFLLIHRALCVLCANPVFQDLHKCVSRRREKKERLRRDACFLRALFVLCAKPSFIFFRPICHTNLKIGFPRRPSSVPSVFSVRTLFFQDTYKTVSRRREKKKRLRRDDRVG